MKILADNYWLYFLVCYLFTITIETPVLLVGLSRRHPLSRRFFAGAWLTACTYPIVFIVLPEIYSVETERWLYLLVAETFAPVAECVLFWVAFGEKTDSWGTFVRDMTAVTVANLARSGLARW